MVEQIDEQFADYHFSDGSGNLYKEVWPLKSNNSIQSDKKFYEGLVNNNIQGTNIDIIKSFAKNILNASDSKFNQ